MASEQRDDTPRNVLPDLVIPVLAFAFTVYYLTTITEVPWIAQASAVFVSVLLFSAIAAFAVRTVLRLRAGTERIGLGGLVDDAPIQVKRMVLLGFTVAFVVLVEHLGFTLSTFGFIFAGILLLSSRAHWKAAAALAATCSIGGYIVFIYLFETRFPKGWIEHTVEALIRYGS